MNLQESIRRILKEETNKFELVKNFIYTMYDNVIDLEYNAERNEIIVYYIDKQKKLEISEICDTINDYTNLNVVPWYEYGKTEPDFYLDVELTEYDEELNESTIVRRRLNELPKHITSSYKWLDPKRFNNFDEFLNRVIFQTVRDFSSELGIQDYERIIEVREEIEPFVTQYINDNYLEDIKYYFDIFR